VRVYDKRPSGLGAADLRAQAERDPRGAAFAAARLLAGVVLVGMVGAPVGLLWLVLGVVLTASAFRFVGAAAGAAIARPALVLTGRPKWDGVRRTSWALETEGADQARAVGRRLAEELDVELGDSLTAFDEDGRHRGATRGEVFDGDAPGLIAWAVRGRPKLAAGDEADGVWLRLDPGETGDRIMVLANDGRAADALRAAAHRA